MTNNYISCSVSVVCVCACIYLSLYLSVYCVLMFVSPFPPGAQLQVRSLVFLDQQVRLTGFSGGTETERERAGQMERWTREGEDNMGEERGEENREKEDVRSLRVQSHLQPTLLQPHPS